MTSTGSILVDEETAVYGGGAYHSVVVQGTIVSPTEGVWLGSGDASDTNATVRITGGGSIVSQVSRAIQVYAANSTVRNDGVVYGKWGGLALAADFGEGRVTNSGSILGSDYGIQIQGAQVVSIVNSGTISGEGFGIHAASDSTTVIRNTGEIAGGIQLGKGHDVYDGRNGRLEGNIVAGSGNDTIYSGADRNYIEGQAGNDILRGYGGGDSLDGGTGKDTLSGGVGYDGFHFTTTLSSSNVDRITDFSVPQDTIAVDKDIFKALSSAVDTFITADEFWASQSGTAHDNSDRIIYETDTGKLVYDRNGSESGGAVQFATLDPNLKITAADFLII